VNDGADIIVTDLDDLFHAMYIYPYRMYHVSVSMYWYIEALSSQHIISTYMSSSCSYTVQSISVS